MLRILTISKQNICVKAILLSIWLLYSGFGLSIVKGQSLIASVSSEVRVSLNLEDVSLKDLITKVEQETGVKFSYDTNEIIKKGNVSIVVIDEPLEKVLQTLSFMTDLEFKILNNLVHISARRSNMQKQENRQSDHIRKKVYGIVKDKFGDPLPGVNIVFDGTSHGTISNADGSYEVLIPLDTEVNSLTFSYVGFSPQKVLVVYDSPMNVTMSFSTKALSGITVIGYGTQKRRDLTGAIATVNQDEISSMPVPSISDALQGRAPGVQVISSGVPGSDAEFRVRGTSTINNSSPLFVIDGIPTRGGLNQLNPNDIETIQVLKDASAAAIYGSQGANGVVIITTKRGAAERNSLNFDYFTGVQRATNLVELLDAAQFATLHNEIMSNNGRPLNPAYKNPSSLGKGTDWLAQLFKPAPIHSYSLSYSHNSERSNMYVSGNIFDQEGIIIHTGFKRYTLQFNSDTRIFDRVKFGNTLSINHDIKRKGDWDLGNTMAALPTQPVMDGQGNYSGPSGNPIWEGNIQNPIGKATLVEHTTKGYNLLGVAYGELEIINDLKFKTTLGLKANIWDDRTWEPKYDWKPNPNPHSFLYQKSSKGFTRVWDNTVTYDKLINNKHHFTILAATSAMEHRYEWMSASVQGFISNSVQHLSNGNLLPVVEGKAEEFALLSYIGRVNYVYSNKYLITATIRHDGSSRLGPKSRWGTFPSLSTAYRISEEAFFKKGNFVNDFKIRAGYGTTGNQEIGHYPFASVFQTVAYNFNGSIVPAVAAYKMPNPNVRWESVEQANLGVDVSLFKGNVFLMADAYIKHTSNMLVPMAVPVTTGFSPVDVPEINKGSMLNKGVELSLSTVNKKGELQWNTDFNFSLNKNRILSLNDTTPLLVKGISLNHVFARQQAGQPVNAFYGFITDGIFQSQEEVEKHAVQVPGNDPYNRTSAGDIRFKDLNNDNIINDSDRTFIGNPNPVLFFGLNNTFSYKGFDLSIFIQGVAGNQIFNANRIWTESMAVPQNQTTATLDRWTGAGTSNTMPRAVFNDPNKNTRISDRYVEDGSYLRLKNITLGYKIPERLTERLKLNTARIYASAQNLYTFTGYSGLDPEVPINGVDFNVYPVARTISLGVNLSF